MLNNWNEIKYWLHSLWQRFNYICWKQYRGRQANCNRSTQNLNWKQFFFALISWLFECLERWKEINYLPPFTTLQVFKSNMSHKLKTLGIWSSLKNVFFFLPMLKISVSFCTNKKSNNQSTDIALHWIARDRDETIFEFFTIWKRNMFDFWNCQLIFVLNCPVIAFILVTKFCLNYSLTLATFETLDVFYTFRMF